MNSILEREPQGTIAHAIKNIPHSEISSIVDSFDFKTKPHDHQARSLYLGLDQDTFIYALDMGLGKTLIGLYLTLMSKQLGKDTKTLVTCPPIVLRQWKKETYLHTDLTIKLVDGKDSKHKIEQLQYSSADITVVSHSWLTTVFSRASKDIVLTEKLKTIFKKFNMLIIDEAHSLKNPKTKGFKGYKKFLLDIERRYLMTGTPVGNDYTGVWSLYYILDKGSTFGTSFSQFVETYFNAFNKGMYFTYKLKSKKRSKFMQLFWEKGIRWEETECNDLPGKTYTTLPVAMTAVQSKMYDDALTSGSEQGYETQEDPTFELMRITAGVKLAGDSPKLEAVKNIVSDICVSNKRQFIIWCWLEEESKYLKTQLTKTFSTLNIATVRGGGTQSSKSKTLDLWANGSIDILIANQKSLGIGIDLYEANVCCFYSNNRSMIDRKQTEKRIHRTGQTKHCTYIDIVCENTIDEVNLSILNHAKDSFVKITKDSDLREILIRQRIK